MSPHISSSHILRTGIFTTIEIIKPKSGNTMSFCAFSVIFYSFPMYKEQFNYIIIFFLFQLIKFKFYTKIPVLLQYYIISCLYSIYYQYIHTIPGQYKTVNINTAGSTRMLNTGWNLLLIHIIFFEYFLHLVT